MQEKIVILDFGSQTTQLIGRRIRELNIYSEIIPYNKYPFGREAEEGIIGVILSGSPLSVYDEGAFKIDLHNLVGRVPVLGICYGAQLTALEYGGSVEPAPSREYGRANLAYVDAACPLFDGIEAGAQVWMSHGDTITSPQWLLPPMCASRRSRARPECGCGACSSTRRFSTAHAACSCSATSR